MPYKDPIRQRTYQRERIARTRAAFFAGKRCVECGATENLELDHVDPASKVSHRIWNWSRSRRERELVKCQVLCRDCHVEKTAEENRFSKTNYDVPHGTRARYDSKLYACRCEGCCEAHAKAVRDWKVATQYRAGVVQR